MLSPGPCAGRIVLQSHADRRCFFGNSRVVGSGGDGFDTSRSRTDWQVSERFGQEDRHFCKRFCRLGVPDLQMVQLTPTEVYCADPVYQQMDINHATLADQSLLNLTAEDSTAIIDTLNRQFSSDGLVFSSKHPLRWYCQFDKALAIETVSLSSATGRDVSLCRPGGADSRRWRTLLAEIEMILFSHPVNQQREARGELPINSLWLWGGGRLPDKVDKTGAVFTNNFYTSSYANHQGMQVLDISDFAANDRPVLVVDDRLATAAATADVELRKQVIGELADVVFAALNRSHGVVKTGAPVSLWCGGDSVWHLPQRINLGHDTPP